MLPLQTQSITVFLSYLHHAFCQRQSVVTVTTIDLSEVSDVSHHGLVVLLLFIDSFSNIRESLVQLLHAHSLHHQFFIYRVSI